MTGLKRAAWIARVIVGALVLAAAAGAQAPPAFEVASIKPSGDEGDQVNAGARISVTQVRFTRLSLKDLIAAAYRMRTSQVVGPDWIAQGRFDIAAKIPDGVSPALVPEMMQALLANRFQMKAHRETKEFPVYALVVGTARSSRNRRRIPMRPSRHRPASRWRPAEAGPAWRSTSAAARRTA